MLTLSEFSYIISTIKNNLLTIKEGHSTWLNETGGWSGTPGRVDAALKALDKLEPLGVSLRDHIALSATEEDIQSFKDLVPEIETAVTHSNGHTQIIRGISIGWRATARYLYADAMLKAREANVVPPKN
jgi:hypothetical protein